MNSEFENKRRNDSPSDEIDLRDVFRGIGNFFRSIGDGIIQFILSVKNITRQYFLMLIIFIIVGLVISIFSKPLFRDYFTAQMTVNSEFYRGEFMSDVVDEIDKLSSEGSYNTLARKLNIPVGAAEDLLGVEVESELTAEERARIDQYKDRMEEEFEDLTKEELDALVERLEKNSGNFKIRVRVAENKSLDQLEEGIIHFLNNNDYVKRQAATRKSNLIAMKSRLQKEQASLDDLKQILAESVRKSAERAGSNNVIFGAEGGRNPLDVYVKDIEFYEQELEINEKLEFMSPIVVVSGFTSFERPASRGLVGRMIIAALVALLIAYLIILIIEANSALNRYEERMVARKRKV